MCESYDLTRCSFCAYYDHQDITTIEDGDFLCVPVRELNGKVTIFQGPVTLTDAGMDVKYNDGDVINYRFNKVGRAVEIGVKNPPPLEFIVYKSKVAAKIAAHDANAEDAEDEDEAIEDEDEEDEAEEEAEAEAIEDEDGEVCNHPVVNINNARM